MIKLFFILIRKNGFNFKIHQQFLNLNINHDIGRTRNKLFPIHA